jgi:hypothetical protein
VQTVVSISPTREDIESDLVRLERENRELRRQLEVAAMGWEEQGRGRGEDEKYEVLVREVIRIHNTVEKVRGIHVHRAVFIFSGRRLKDNV